MNLTQSEYMRTPEEMAKQPDAFRFFEEVAEGNVAVYNAMCSFWNFAHAFDDLVDNANLPSEKKELVFKALHDFVTDLLVNPFITSNAREIRAMFVSAMTRCLDGDRMKQGTESERKLAPAVACGDIDVLMHMAYLARGWDAMRKWSPMRRYDVEETKG